MIIIRPTQVNGASLVSSTVPETDFTRTSTVTIAGAVITWTDHRLPLNTPVNFTTTGTLPTGLVIGTTYYVTSGFTTNTFSVSATPGGAAITTTGGSGTHVATYNSSWSSTKTYPLSARVIVSVQATVVGDFSSLPAAGMLASTGSFTCTSVTSGSLYVGMELSGANIPRGMTIVAQKSGVTGSTGAVSYTHLTLPTNREV